MKAIILGLGQSLNNWKRQKNEFVIGCNNIYDYQKDIDAICIVDPLPALLKKRPTVFNTPEHVYKYCRDIRFSDFFKRFRHIESFAHTFNNSFNYKTLPINHGYTCPFYATVLAMYLGYKEIEIFGVDHNNGHVLDNDFSKQRTSKEFSQLIKFAETQGINIYFNDACLIKERVQTFLNYD